MKKITLILTICFCFALMQSNAQYSFTAIPGPVNVANGSPVTLNINDLANGAGVPVGLYDTFSVSADWTAGSGGPWSSDADLSVMTTSGTVFVDPATTGAINDGSATTLTFDGTFSSNYDPGVDGFLDIVLNQSFANSNANWSNIVVTINLAPLCTSPTATAVEVDNCGDAEFSIDVDVTSLGDATSVTISNDAGVPPTTVVATGPITVGPFPAGIGGEVNLTLEHDQDSECNVDLGIFDDSCTGLPPVTIATFNLNCTQSDTATGTYEAGDVFWVEVIYGGGCDALTIDTFTSSVPDTEIGIYDNTGTLLGFNDDAASGGTLSEYIQNGLVAGTYYVAASSFNTNFGATGFNVSTTDNSSSGDLVINALAGASLSTSDVEDQSLFSYYPNSVKNTLTLNARNNIENVRMYNMLGQEVMNAQPQTVDSELDMSRLDSGTYFVQVTIANVTKTVRVIKQ